MDRAKQTQPAEAAVSVRAISSAEWPELAYRELVTRIVASQAFARSERLCAFLKYICDMTLKGRQAELNEQKIGHAVFGRQRGYDSSIDGIVRTQASRLRQRLDLYFDGDGAAEPVRLVLPKGGYVPQFVPRVATEDPQPGREPAPAAPPETVFQSHAIARLPQLLPWILCCALAVTSLLLYTSILRERHTQSAHRAHPLWDRLLVPGQSTLAVTADSGLVISHVFDPRDVPLVEYLSADFHGNNGAPALAPAAKELRTDLLNRRYTSIVDLEAAVTLSHMARAMQSTVQVRYARDLRPNDLKSGNVILMGAFESNPWVELFEKTMDFALENNYRTHEFAVVNRHPAAGEPARWISDSTDPRRKVYGVVAFLPGLSDTGHALLVEGTSMAGTEAAWDFVANDAALLPFLRRIQNPDGTIPHFELVLGTQNMSSSAVQSELLAWRVVR